MVSKYSTVSLYRGTPHTASRAEICPRPDMLTRINIQTPSLLRKRMLQAETQPLAGVSAQYRHIRIAVRAGENGKVMNFLDAASLTAVTSSTFPGLSRAEGLREVQALNSDENQAASQHEQQQPTQDLLVHGDGKNGGGLLAGWLAAEAPTPHLSGRETCRAISDERARSNGYLDGMSSSSSHHRHSGGYKTSRAITRGDVVSVERPVAAMQTSSALPWVIACPGCLRHVGTLDLQLAIASGRCDRARALEFDQPPTPRCTERFASRASGDSENDISRAKEHGTAAAAAAARAPTTTTGSSRDHSSVGKKVGQEASRTFHEEDGREEDGKEVGREEHRGVRRRGGHGGGGDCNGRLPTVSGLSDRFMEVRRTCFPLPSQKLRYACFRSGRGEKRGRQASGRKIMIAY